MRQMPETNIKIPKYRLGIVFDVHNDEYNIIKTDVHNHGVKRYFVRKLNTDKLNLTGESRVDQTGDRSATTSRKPMWKLDPERDFYDREI